jgi:ATP-dependent DNA ligase
MFDLRCGSFNDWSRLGLSHMPAKELSFEPMLCEKAEQPPEGPEWRYELKLDGYRR